MKTFLLGLLMTGSALAALIEPAGNEVTKVEEVSIREQVKSGLFPTALKLTGAGKRVKKIVLIKVDVYAAAHYIDPVAKLSAADPLTGIREAKAKALHLTFLRDVDAEKIRNSFSDALKENKVDLESPMMKLAFSKLTFDMKKGQSVSLLGLKKEGDREVLHFESPAGSFQIEGPGAASEFWKIWFGEPEDSGLEKLKAALLSRV